MKTPAAILRVLLLLFLSGMVFAQNDTASESEEVLSLLDKLDRSAAELVALNGQIETAGELDWEALTYRRDERSFNLLLDLEFGIGYGDDLEHAERVLQDIVSSHDKVLDNPEATIKLHALADSSVNFVVRPWVRTEDYWDVHWDVTHEVKLRFDREGIYIPFPQRDMHVYQE